MVTGPCDPGYFCNAGSDRADPTDGIMGNVCPEGRYCGKSNVHVVKTSKKYFLVYFTKIVSDLVTYLKEEKNYLFVFNYYSRIK